VDSKILDPCFHRGDEQTVLLQEALLLHKFVTIAQSSPADVFRGSFHCPSSRLNTSLKVRMDSIMASNNIQVRTRMPMVSPIFHATDVFGRHQIRGNARGPTEQTARTIKDVRKYHLIFSSAARGGPFRNSPQCLHFIAAS
jgi:hypothetical protein